MKYSFLALALTLFSACRSTPPRVETIPITSESPQPSATPAISPSPTPTPVPTSPSTAQLKVVIQSATGYNSEGLARLEKARGLLEIIVNTDSFKQKVINATYQGQKQFVQNNGLSNEQVYNLIFSGAEKYPSQTPTNNTIDLYSALYTSSWWNRNVIGYTTPNTQTVYMNTYFFNDASASEIAGNLMHEWLHKVGFDHDSNSTARRPYTVPYAIGYIAEDLVATLE